MFIVALYVKVTPQMGLLKNSQNETFGFTLKNFAWGFYFLTSIYIQEVGDELGKGLLLNWMIFWKSSKKGGGHFQSMLQILETLNRAF